MTQFRLLGAVCAISLLASRSANAQGASGGVSPQPIYVEEIPPSQPSPRPQPAPRPEPTEAAETPDARQLEKWEPGAPVPAGYHAETRTRRGLVLGGAGTFVGFYGTALFAAWLASAAGAGGKVAAMWVPLVGPFIQMGQPDSKALISYLFLDGVGQIAGITMLVAGLLSPQHVLVRNDAGIRVTPVGLGNGRVGWGLTGTF